MIPPSDPVDDLAARALIQRKRRDQALILPLAGIFLFLSPLIGIFASAGKIAGIPAILLYLPVIWIALIVVAFRLSRCIEDDSGKS